MTRQKPRNLPASVRGRLQDLARRRKEDFQLLLTRYGLERLLYRVSKSPHRDVFVLKGAMLFQLWSDVPHRPTRDVDFLGRGEISIPKFEGIFREICTQQVEPDGLDFLPASVRGEEIKEGDEYQGLRIRLIARLERAEIRSHVDIGFGDAITPAAAEVQYPSLLGFPAPAILAYPKETVVAEKFQAIVQLGIANSRMKDYFDLWVMAQQFAFDGELLGQAIEATFQRRRTALPAKDPLGLSPAFGRDGEKRRQWRAFLWKGRLLSEERDLEEVVAIVGNFLLPPSESARAKQAFSMHWPAGGPWR